MRATTLTQLQDATIALLLRIPAQTQRGSGALQARMRRPIYRQYRQAAEAMGYTAEQINAQVEQLREMVELEQISL